MIAELLNVLKQLLKKPNSKADVAHYIFFARIAVLLAKNQRKIEVKEFAEKVFELELKIDGNTLTTQSLILKRFITGRQLYYMTYASDILQFAK